MTIQVGCTKHNGDVKNKCTNCQHDNCDRCKRKCVNCNKQICYFCSYTQFAIRVDNNVKQSGIYSCYDCKDKPSNIFKFNIHEEYAIEFTVTSAIKSTISEN
jgi:hypothetical protein